MRTILLILSLFIAATVSAQVSLTSGLVAYYPFSGDYNDHSGNGHNGIPHAMSLTTDKWGHTNSAALFGGDSSWVEIPASPSLTTSKHLSVSFRYNTNVDSSRIEYLMSKSDFYGTGTTNNVQYQILLNDATNFGKGLTFGTTHNNSCTTTAYNPGNYLNNGHRITPNAWHCIVLTFDTGSKNMYIDNVLIASDTAVGVSPKAIDSCVNGILKLGAWWQGGPLYFSGIMDEVRIYNRTLNIAEIDTLCSINALDIKEVADNNDVILYPNPTTDLITLHLPDVIKSVMITVYNQLGQVVLNQQLDKQVSTIDTRSLPASTYIIRINTGQEIITKQFVKQ